MTEAVLCTRCVLTNAVPGVVLHDGICNICTDSSGSEATKLRRLELSSEMIKIIDQKRNKSEYDCIVAFSGGKDSSYTLMMLTKNLGLRCLAVTVDNGFISDQAITNCKSVTSSLGVDFVTYTPAFDFMRTMYVKSMQDDSLHVKSAIRRASGACNSCINLINTYMLKTAARHGIPIVAGGYVGGQVPRDAAIMRLNLKQQQQQHATALGRKTAAFGENAKRYFDIGSLPPGSEEIVVINPMLTVSLSESEIIQAISALGWQQTVDTGLNSSNCMLNDLGILMHYRRHQFHPYAFEISEQIRSGLMSREEGLRKIGSIPKASELASQLQRLNMAAGEL